MGHSENPFEPQFAHDSLMQSMLDEKEKREVEKPIHLLAQAKPHTTEIGDNKDAFAIDYAL